MLLLIEPVISLGPRPVRSHFKGFLFSPPRPLQDVISFDAAMTADRRWEHLVPRHFPTRFGAGEDVRRVGGVPSGSANPPAARVVKAEVWRSVALADLKTDVKLHSHLIEARESSDPVRRGSC